MRHMAWVVSICVCVLGLYAVARKDSAVWKKAQDTAAAEAVLWQQSLQKSSDAVQALGKAVLADELWVSWWASRSAPVVLAEAPAPLPSVVLQPLLAKHPALLGVSVWEIGKWDAPVLSLGEAVSPLSASEVLRVSDEGFGGVQLHYNASMKQLYGRGVWVLDAEKKHVWVLHSRCSVSPVGTGFMGYDQKVVLGNAASWVGSVPKGLKAPFFKPEKPVVSLWGQTFGWRVWFANMQHAGVGVYPVQALLGEGLWAGVFLDTRVFYQTMALKQVAVCAFSLLLCGVLWWVLGRVGLRPKNAVQSVGVESEPVFETPQKWVEEKALPSQASFESALEEPPTQIIPLTPPQPLAEEKPTTQDAYRVVFENFVAMRASCGEAGELSFERFALRLQESKEMLMQKHACADVVFEVYMKNGKAALKAMPVGKG